MSHYDDARAQQQADAVTAAQQLRKELASRMAEPIKQLEDILVTARFALPVEEREHLRQKLRELKCLMVDYCS